MSRAESAARSKPKNGPLRPAGAGLEARIGSAGSDLLSALGAAVEAIPDQPAGPQALAKRIGVDKVLASRFLAAMRAPDPISVIHRIPGPEPLRRVLRAIGRQGVDPAIVRDAGRAIDRFESLIRDELGDRSALDAVVSAWVPAARKEFELRRKQAAFRAMSQLRGAEARTIIAAVFLHPNPDGSTIDVVWVNGVIGLHRLRPGAHVKFATRRLSSPTDTERRPETFEGPAVDGVAGVQISEFCSKPMPRLRAHRIGEVVHYTLAEEGFGPRSAVDIVFGEVNRAEIKRSVPRGSGRKRYVFAEVNLPCKSMLFDAFIHADLIRPDAAPALRLYDTSFEGVANANDPARDADLLDLTESIEPLGTGIDRCRSAEAPRYTEMLSRACERMGWTPGDFRGFRCAIEYPVYGSQAMMVMEAEEERA